MEYRATKNGERIEIHVSGKLTFDENEVFRSMMNETVESGENRIVMDLTNIEFADSAGLGLLLRMKSEADAKSKAVVLKVPKDGQVRKMLDVARFNQMIPYENG